MDGRRIVVGTGNPGKIREIAVALNEARIAPVTIGDLVPHFDPVEDGANFLDNARIKAVAAVLATGLPACADDSGLCVVGLGLEPGIRSARYAGPGKSDGERTEYLLEQMADLTGAERRAYFQCALCAYVPEQWLSPHGRAAATGSQWPGLVELVTEGRFHGHIGDRAKGDGGFGYDPVFIPDGGSDRSLAQYSIQEKNVVSHRGLALAELRKLVQ
jgi:non-canonical purine NTP pyrophosphatase (RdgB/HAM1 family)